MYCRIVAYLLLHATLLLAAPAAKDKDLGFQKKADAAAWEWNEQYAMLDFSIKRCKLKVETSVGDQRQATITVTPDAGEPVTFEGHIGTSFIVRGLTLYYTDYHLMSTGCALVAIELKTGKQLWKKSLKGLGPISQFKYFNAVMLDTDDGAIRILGKESSGRYIEFVDLETGKTLGHKVFAKD